jgi:2-amino-4-hydroxy-6-hydroxymethyldihydropteridine diphosphokinase
LDILLQGELEVHQAGLEIPHSRLAERAFVLVPLWEIAAQVFVPGRGETVGQLLTKLLEGSTSESDAVVRMQCSGWDAR